MTQQVAMTSLTERYTAEEGRFHLTGVQALVRMLLDQQRADRRAGRHTAAFVSGYEGSPLGGFDLELHATAPPRRARRPPTAGLNEELAAHLRRGHPARRGHRLATRRRRRRLLVRQGARPRPRHRRPAPRQPHRHPPARRRASRSSGTTRRPSRRRAPAPPRPSLADLAVPVLFPADPQDVLDLGRHARRAVARIGPVGRAQDRHRRRRRLGHASTSTPTACAGRRPDLTVDGRPYGHTPDGTRSCSRTSATIEREPHGARLELARRYAAANGLNRIVGHGPRDRIGIVAAGKPRWLDLRQALRHPRARRRRASTAAACACCASDDLAARARDRRPASPTASTRSSSSRRSARSSRPRSRSGSTAAPARPPCTASAGPTARRSSPSTATSTPTSSPAGLAGRLLAHGSFPSVASSGATRRPRRSRIDLSLTPSTGVHRTPFFCSGCPHNTSTTAIPEGSLVGAGIGCHTMVLLMTRGRRSARSPA